MKWNLLLASDDIHHWQLQKEEGHETLRFNRQWLSLRLSGTSKRLLFLRVQGLLQKKIILQTEYGIQLGETALADQLSAGQLVLNEQKLFYETTHDRLRLFDAEREPLASCELAPEAFADKLEYYALLFGFAWFATAKTAVEEVPLVAVSTPQ